MEKAAIVTGAGSGIGRAVTLALASSGYVVVAAGRRRTAIQETASLAASGQVVPITADVADEDSVDRLFAEVRRRFGRLELLFNNAGSAAPGSVDDLTLEAWRGVIDTNLTGAFLCARAAVRLMKSQEPRGGRIINNGSISAHSPRPNSVAYVASKHAITGLTRSIALDGRAYDIACGQIDIGNAATDMTARMATGALQANGELAPEPTFDVGDVGRAVVFMATLPPSANALFLTLMATRMPFVGRG